MADLDPVFNDDPLAEDQQARLHQAIKVRLQADQHDPRRPVRMVVIAAIFPQPRLPESGAPSGLATRIRLRWACL